MVRLDQFRPTNFERGASKPKEILWVLVRAFFFLSPIPWPNRIKASLLRMFGAKVGKGLYLRPRVNIHFPWKLTLGDYCWIGDSCELLNLEPITFEDHVALAHEVYLAAGSHDVRSRTMKYANRPIYIGSGTWVATRAFIGPGVTIGRNCVVGACAVVLASVDHHSIVTGPRAEVTGKREITRD
jgi:putative colanic acid biosynthesis acetyltransferase WcaF